MEPPHRPDVHAAGLVSLVSVVWSLAASSIAIALGILIDTVIVRSVLVTALTLDIGRRMWWPSKLARRPATETDITAEPPAVGG